MFKIHKIRYLKPKRIGYENAFFRFVKVVNKKHYAYGIRTSTNKTIVIHEGRKSKLLNAATLTILSILFSVFIKPFIYIIGFIRYYCIGCKNFIDDSVYIDGIRFFNWANIVIIFVLIILLIFKCI